jgi:hypothetical protein
MTGSALMDFLIACVGLCIIIYMIFRALDFISPDDRFKDIGRYAVGGVALLAFLIAIKGVLFGSGGAMAMSPQGIIQFAVGLIVVMVVLFIIYMVVDRLAPADLAVPVKYVIGAIALIAILLLAQQVLFGGGLALSGPNAFRLGK